MDTQTKLLIAIGIILLIANPIFIVIFGILGLLAVVIQKIENAQMKQDNE